MLRYGYKKYLYEKEVNDLFPYLSKENKKETMFFHFPGTGAGGNDYSFPNFVERDHNCLQMFDVAGGGDTTPALLAIKDEKKSLLQIISESPKSDFDELLPQSTDDDETIGTFGNILGVGMKKNAKIIMNTLEIMDDEDLPKEIVLEGRSRGAINAIVTANEIYKKYGNKIKVHLVLVDPVPGPFHERERDKKVIPPNVKSFTSFYTSDDGMNAFFKPTSLKELVFTNKKTFISSFAFKNIGHNYLHENNSPYLRFAKHLLYAGIIGYENFLEEQLEYFKQIMEYCAEDEHRFANIDEMKNPKKNRSGCRKNAHLYGTTGLEDKEDTMLVKVLKKIRRYFETGGDMETINEEEEKYKDDDKGAKNIFYSEIHLDENASEKKRGQALRHAYKDLKYTMTTEEWLATLLILPTLGFSTYIYHGKRIHDPVFKTLYVIAALTTLPLFYQVGKASISSIVTTINFLWKSCITKSYKPSRTEKNKQNKPENITGTEGKEPEEMEQENRNRISLT